MKRIKDWLFASNRWKHAIGGFIIGLGADSSYCAAYTGIGVAGALEFKDRAWGGKWDWTDFGCTAAGAAAGRAARMLMEKGGCVW